MIDGNGFTLKKVPTRVIIRDSKNSMNDALKQKQENRAGKLSFSASLLGSAHWHDKCELKEIGFRIKSKFAHKHLER